MMLVNSPGITGGCESPDMGTGSYTQVPGRAASTHNH